MYYWQQSLLMIYAGISCLMNTCTVTITVVVVVVALY